MKDGWFAAAGQYYGSSGNWQVSYSVVAQGLETQRAAIKQGFLVVEHDDFNVGQVLGGKLTWWGYMSEKHPDEDYSQVAADLGLGVSS